MKVSLYFDHFPGSDPKYFMAMSNPGKKTEGVIRYKINFTVPDVHKPDGEVEAIVEEVPDES